jgi:hypothetical protein
MSTIDPSNLSDAEWECLQQHLPSDPLLIFLLCQIGSASYGVAISREMHQGLYRESDQLEQSESWFYHCITVRMYQVANTSLRAIY